MRDRFHDCPHEQADINAKFQEYEGTCFECGYTYEWDMKALHEKGCDVCIEINESMGS